MVDLRPDHLAVVRAILKAELPSTEVWAFGSRATWTARDSSDLDLVIVGDRPLSLRTLSRLQRAFEESYLPFSVDLVDWSQVSEDFRSIILKQRVVLQPGRAAGSGGQEDHSWRAVPLSECADFVSGGTLSRSNPEYWGGDIPWVTAKDMKQLRLSDTLDHVTPQALGQGARLVPGGTVLVRVRGMTLHADLPICITRRPMAFNQDVRALRPRPHVDADYLAYALLADKPALLSLVDAASHGTGRIHSAALASFPIALPPLAEQRAIAHVLGTLDDKIELNRRMSQTLEAMAQAIFNAWFVNREPVQDTTSPRLIRATPPTGDWTVQPLDSIANFLNGLALQKYPVNEDEEFLPVIKIAELRNGMTTNSARAGLEVPAEYVIEDGTVLFSWSGALEVAVWTGGRGALNQRIFKVTSEKYPKWLYLYWLKEHLALFRSIAAGKATTMGHIQRHHLSEAIVAVPPEDLLRELDQLMSPVLDRQICNDIESHTLTAIRDALLPKLLSGEVRVRAGGEARRGVLLGDAVHDELSHRG